MCTFIITFIAHFTFLVASSSLCTHRHDARCHSSSSSWHHCFTGNQWADDDGQCSLRGDTPPGIQHFKHFGLFSLVYWTQTRMAYTICPEQARCLLLLEIEPRGMGKRRKNHVRNGFVELIQHAAEESLIMLSVINPAAGYMVYLQSLCHSWTHERLPKSCYGNKRSALFTKINIIWLAVSWNYIR